MCDGQCIDRQEINCSIFAVDAPSPKYALYKASSLREIGLGKVPQESKLLNKLVLKVVLAHEYSLMPVMQKGCLCSDCSNISESP